MRNINRLIIIAFVITFSVPTIFASNTTVPNITLHTAEGDLALKNLHGQVVYIDFWASWCGPCRKSFSWMNEMQGRYGANGFKIVAINVDIDQALAEKFLKKYPANFTIAYDAKGVIAKQFEVKGMPSSYLIDRNGHILSSSIGFTEKEAMVMEEKIKSAVSQS